jgi:hypothetical protein
MRVSRHHIWHKLMSQLADFDSHVRCRRAVRQSVPRHSYVSYWDIWMVSTMFFIFMSLVEFTFVIPLSASEYNGNFIYLFLNFVHENTDLIYWPNIIYTAQLLLQLRIVINIFLHFNIELKSSSKHWKWWKIMEPVYKLFKQRLLKKFFIGPQPHNFMVHPIFFNLDGCNVFAV